MATTPERSLGKNGQADAQEQASTLLAPSRLLVAVPAYNEARFIGSVVLQARLDGYDVLVVDDGSADRTADLASAAGATVQIHAGNHGKAEALNTIFRYAKGQGVDHLVVMDGDGQHDAREIELLLRPILRGEADIVVGSRFLASSNGEVPAVRRAGQAVLTALTNLLSGVAVTDSQSGFRAFSRRAIETLDFAAGGFSVEAEMQFKARERALRIAEAPITAIYHERPKRNVFSHGRQVLNGVLRLIGRHRPLLFFGLPGLALLLFGVGMGLLVISIYAESQQLAVGYSLITVLSAIAGLHLLSTGISLHVLRLTYLELARQHIDGHYLGTGDARREA